MKKDTEQPISCAGIIGVLTLLAGMAIMPIPVGTLAIINEEAAFGKRVLTNTERAALLFFDAMKALFFVGLVLDIGVSRGRNLDKMLIPYAVGAMFVFPILFYHAPKGGGV